MSTNAVWLRRLRDSCIATIVVAVAISSCDVDSRSDDSGVPGLQTCDSCIHALKPVAKTILTGLPTESIWFNEPVAIEFFNLAGDHDLFDSLYESGRSQSYYYLMDQAGIYTSIMLPVLDSLKVMVIASVPAARYLIFGDSTSNYIVNIEQFQSDDGVLMFTPGKPPVYWQEANLNRSCIEETFLKCYFGK